MIRFFTEKIKIHFIISNMTEFSSENPTMLIQMDTHVEQIGAGQDIALSMTIDDTDIIAILDGHGPDIVTDIIREEKNIENHFKQQDPAVSLQQLIESKIAEKKQQQAKIFWKYNCGISYKQYLKNQINDKNIRRSGSTLSFAKIKRNMEINRTQIHLEWLGDSPIMVFINGELVFNAIMHHSTNQSECDRLRALGVLKSIKEGYYGLEIVDENTIEKKIGKYVYFTNNEGLACTRSLGHNRITGIETQKVVIDCSIEDEIKVIISSDGVGDMLNLNYDMERLKTFNAYEIVKFAEQRWKQPWIYGKTQIEMDKYDDCSCCVWWQKKA